MPEKTAALDEKILRQSRDNLIDALGFGQTYAVSDIETIEGLKVAAGSTGSVPLTPSQKTVTYLLCDSNGTPISVDDQQFSVSGDQQEPLLTHPIQEDGIYKIQATKTHGPEYLLQTFLNQTVEIKVGIDVNLVLTFYLDKEESPTTGINLVDSEGGAPSYLFPYNSATTITVHDAQEQVRYQLVEVDPKEAERALSEEKIGLGRGKFIRITSEAITEDLTLHVRAVRIFDDDRENERELLTQRLHANIQANPALPLSISASKQGNAKPITTVPQEQESFLHIDNSQTSVFYRVFGHKILDNEISFEGNVWRDDNRVNSGFNVEGNALYVKRPNSKAILNVNPLSDKVPNSYTLVGDGEYVPGNGARLSLALPAIEEDMLYVVQTQKQHRWKQGKAAEPDVRSFGFIHQATTLLVEPLAGVALELRFQVQNDAASYHTLVASQGENDITYTLSLGKLEYKADFAGPKEGLTFEGLNVPIETPFSVLAEKNRTRVQQNLLGNDTLPVKSNIAVERNSGTAEVSIPLSQEQVSYCLYLNGQMATNIQVGTGKSLILSLRDGDFAGRTLRDLADDTFVLRESHKIDKINIHFDHPVLVTDTRLKTLCVNGASLLNSNAKLLPFPGVAEVSVSHSQLPVVYQAVQVGQDNTEKTASPKVAGTGNSIQITTQALQDDGPFYIRATHTFKGERETESERLDTVLQAVIQANTQANVFISLAARVSKKVQNNPPIIQAYGKSSFINIENSQASVRYRVLAHKVLNDEISFDVTKGNAQAWLASGFISDDDPLFLLYTEQNYITHTGNNNPFLASLPDAYELVHDYVPGTNGPLQIPLPPLYDDRIYVVQTEKSHQWLNDTGQTVEQSSYDFLHKPAILLVEPKLDTALRFTFNVNDHTIEITDGQPGTFYLNAFKTIADDGTVSDTEQFKAYFHYWEDEANMESLQSSQSNQGEKGVGGLRVERDFVLVDDQLPRQSFFGVYRYPAKVKLNVMAEKGVTKVQKPLLNDMELPQKTAILVSRENGQAWVNVGQSQKGVAYTLYVNHQAATQTVLGTGGELTLVITDEALGQKSLNELADDAFILRETHSLSHMFIDFDHNVLMTETRLKVDFTSGTAIFDDPRCHLFTFGVNANIVIEATQATVTYQTVQVDEQNVVKQTLSGLVSGNGKGVGLTSKTLTEDHIQGIQTTQAFEGNRETENALLDTSLHVYIQARTDTAIFISSTAADDTTITPTLAYGGKGFINIPQSQASVRYRVLAYKILDEQIKFDAAPVSGEYWLNSGFVSDGDPLYVFQAERDALLKASIFNPFGVDIPEGYQALSDYVAGTDGPLSIALPPLREDILYVIQTQKDHRWVEEGKPAITQSTYDFLQQPAALLVEPKLDTPLRLRFNLNEHTMDILDGEPGTSYIGVLNELAKDGSISTTEPFRTYFHLWDNTTSNNVGKGLDALRIERDFVVVDEQSPRQAFFNAYRYPPKAKLGILAEKGVTKVQRSLLGETDLPETSVIGIKRKKGQALVTVRSSQTDADYALYVNNQVATEILSGTGSDLVLSINHGTVGQRSLAELADEGFVLRETHKRSPVLIDFDHAILVTQTQFSTILTTGKPLFNNGHCHLFPFGGVTSITVDGSQTGVAYQTVQVDTEEEVLKTLTETVTGDGEAMVFTCEPFTEDHILRIQATQSFDSNRETENAFLNTALYAHVQARTDIGIFISTIAGDISTPIVTLSHGEQGFINIQNSQASVGYRVLAHKISNRGIKFDASVVKGEHWLNSGIISDGEPLYVLQPGRDDIVNAGTKDPLNLSIPVGYEAVNDYVSGTDGILSIELPPLREDMLYIVQTRKDHRWVDNKSSTVTQSSYDFLTQPATLLVGPNVNTALHLRFNVNHNTLEMFNGEPGVFYTLSFLNAIDGDTSNVTNEFDTYFHQVDERGVDALRVERDFALSGNQRTDEGFWEALALPKGLRISAQRGATKVERLILDDTLLQEKSSVSLVQIEGKIQASISDSHEGKTYTLYRNAQAVSNGVTGTGATLVLRAPDNAQVEDAFIVRESYEQAPMVIEYEHNLVLKG